MYWLPVEVNTVSTAWDVAGVYVSYDCQSVSQSLLRRFHDHLSICQALDGYAQARDIRDLFNRHANRKAAWEDVVQTLRWRRTSPATARRCPAPSASASRGWTSSWHWQSLKDLPDLTRLDGCGSEKIVACLDRAVSSGQAYITAYADALADGKILRDEASQLNRSAADWKADMTALNQTMSDVFRSLSELYVVTSDPQLCDTIEKMIRAMTPWRTGECDDFGLWTPSSPSYLDVVIQTLTDFPTDDIFVPPEP